MAAHKWKIKGYKYLKCPAIITIITHLLFKDWEGNWKYKLENSTDLVSGSHCRAECTINISMPAKTTSNALQ